MMKQLLGCAMTLMAFMVTAEESPPPWLSESPQQLQPALVPVTQLPAKFVSAAGLLFQFGLADPRGCEYREIEVVSSGNIHSMSRSGKIHGWLLPEKDGVTQRFAICWNGLVYPVLSIGAIADCRDDMWQMLKIDRENCEKALWEHKILEERRSKEAKQLGRTFSASSPHFRYQNTLERSSIEYEYIMRLKAVLCFRLGYADLAEAIWAQWYVGNPDESAKDMFVELSEEWAQALAQQAICAHMRADDGLALHAVRLLNRARSLIESEADKRGLKPKSWQKRKLTHLSLFHQLPELLADQERRAKESTRNRIVPRGERNVTISNLDGTPAPYVAPPELKNYADTQKRIVALIRDLELMDEREFEINTDPIILALIAEGDAALEPLIACLESDNRLTRSTANQMRIVIYQEIIPVHHYAKRVLCEILHLDPTTEMWDEMRATQRPGYNPSAREQCDWMAARFRKEMSRRRRGN